jgi:hypothetical protein
MFLPYAIEDNIERKKTELNVVLNTINKGNGNKVHKGLKMIKIYITEL